MRAIKKIQKADTKRKLGSTFATTPSFKNGFRMPRLRSAPIIIQLIAVRKSKVSVDLGRCSSVASGLSSNVRSPVTLDGVYTDD